MAWTAPRTWVSGELVTASIMNTYIRDNQNLLKTPINDSGELEFTDASQLTIATGVITVIQNYHKVDTEGDAGTDDLATITAGTDVAAGFVLHLRVEDAARTVVLKDGTGNLDIGADVTLDETYKTYSLVYDGTNWRPWSFAAQATFAGLSPLTTRGDILYSTSGTVTGTRLAVGAANTVLGSDGTDTAWQLKPLTTRGDILYGSSGTPTGTRLAAGAANTLLGSDGTDVAWQLKPLTTRGDILYGSSGVPTGTRLAVGAANTVLGADGTDTAWQLKPLTTRGDILYASSGVPTGTRLSVGGANEVLTSDGTDVAWAAAAAGGKVVQVQSFYYEAQVGSTSSTFATTNCLDTITLADSNNKCLVIASCNGISKTGATSMKVRVSRAISGGATTIIPAAGNYEQQAGWTATTGTASVGGSTIATLDNPETASEITYTIEFANAQNVSNTYVQVGNGRSTITLIEIEV